MTDSEFEYGVVETAPQRSVSAKLAALDAAMTPGPWEADNTTDMNSDYFDDPDDPGGVKVPETGWFRRGPGTVDIGEYSTLSWADAEGMATYRNALPELVALVAAACGVFTDLCCCHVCPCSEHNALRAAVAALDAKLP